MVVLQGMSPEDAPAKVAKKEQELLDDFFTIKFNIGGVFKIFSYINN